MADFVALIDKNRGIIYHIIHKYCKDENYFDDLFQDIICRAWPSFPNLKNERAFPKWIARVATYTAIDRIKCIKNNTILSNNIFYEIVDEEYTEQQIPAIETFSKTEQATLQMIINGLTYEEISRKMGEPSTRIRVRMHRLRQRLSKQIKY